MAKQQQDFSYAADIAIQAVAVALRKNVNEAKLDNVLNNLSIAARGFWYL